CPSPGLAITGGIDMISYKCPNCATEHSAAEAQAGTKHECSNHECRQRIQVPHPVTASPRNKTVLGKLVEGTWANPGRSPGPVTAPAAQAPAVARGETDPVGMRCPHCARAVRVPA